MKSLKLVLGLALGTTGLGGVAAYGVANNVVSKVFPTEASAPTNQRRLWIIDNNGNSGDTSWWTGSTLYVYYWNSNGDGTIKVPKSNMVLDDYYKGLWYVDITLKDITTSFNVIVRVGNDEGPYGWGDNNQTGTQPLGALGGDDVIWLNNGHYRDNTENRYSRNASIGTTNGFSGAQLAVVMSKYNTCSSNVTNGYNAYPQIKHNFIDKTAASELSTKVYGQNVYTIQDYVDGMYLRYSKQ